jgi:uncharacterized membrane protein YjjP (DUF1212 family)
MTPPLGEGEPAPRLADVQQLVVHLGTTMVAAGDAVDVIEGSLRRVIDAYGVRDVEIALLPTSLFVETGAGTSAHVEFTSQVAAPLRLDQISALYELVKQLERGQLTPAEGLQRLTDVDRLRPTFSWPVRTLGHAILTAGLALLLEPTPAGFVAAFVLGLLVGLFKLLELPTAAPIVPIVASFATAAIVFGTAPYLHVDNPIRLLVAPLVTFLPGGVLAIATMELAAGQMVSGASRLVSGFVQLALLAFGILAASELISQSRADLVDHRVAGVGDWAAWLGVVVFTIGIYLHFSAPLRSLPWILFVLLVAFAGQSLGDVLFGGQLSGFVGAVIMTPLALSVENLPHGPPKLVTFLPAFWLLVPGATGLIGVTQIVGAGTAVGARAFTDVLVSIVSIALGVLIGASAYETAEVGFRRLARTARN